MLPDGHDLRSHDTSIREQNINLLLSPGDVSSVCEYQGHTT